MSNLPKICKKLRELRACREAVRYVGRGTKWQDRWDKCRHPDWMFWLLVRQIQQASIRERRLVLKCLCECIRPCVESVPEAKLAIAGVLSWTMRKRNTAAIASDLRLFQRKRSSIEARVEQAAYEGTMYYSICNTVYGILHSVPLFAKKTGGRCFADTVSRVAISGLNARRYAQLRDKAKSEGNNAPTGEIWFSHSTQFYNAECRRMADVVRKHFPKVPKL